MKFAASFEFALNLFVVNLAVPEEMDYSMQGSLAGTSLASHGSSETFSLQEDNK